MLRVVRVGFPVHRESHSEQKALLVFSTSCPPYRTQLQTSEFVESSRLDLTKCLKILCELRVRWSKVASELQADPRRRVST